MKKLIASSLLLISANVFSQSLMVLSNGVTLSTDKDVAVYDFGLFHLPYTITTVGAQYFVDKDVLYTVNSTGNVYSKDKEIKADRVIARGGNFIFMKNNLLTIDEAGFYYEYKETRFAKPQLIGGNFMTYLNEKTKKVELMSVTNTGLYSVAGIKLEGLEASDIKEVGGMFFTTTKKKIYSVDKTGVVTDQTAFAVVSKIVKKGGNFLIDDTKTMFTFSDLGFIKVPVLPVGMDLSKIDKIGSNYLIDTDGRLFGVDSTGEIKDRGLTTHDLKKVQITTQF